MNVSGTVAKGNIPQRDLVNTEIKNSKKYQDNLLPK